LGTTWATTPEVVVRPGIAKDTGEPSSNSEKCPSAVSCESAWGVVNWGPCTGFRASGESVLGTLIGAGGEEGRPRGPGALFAGRIRDCEGSLTNSGPFVDGSGIFIR